MTLEILSAETPGARGLCCRVQVGDRVMVIDPGIALGSVDSRQLETLMARGKAPDEAVDLSVRGMLA